MVSSDSAVRVLVFRSLVPGVFCAGEHCIVENVDFDSNRLTLEAWFYRKCKFDS